MIQRLQFSLSVVLTLLFAGTASAQWFGYKTPGLPRTADGKPILTAPRPTLPDGKPDLTGLWRLEPKTNPGTLFEAAGPQPWVVDAARKFMHELGRDDTGVHCLPSGPRALVFADLAKFVHTPTLMTVLYESMDTARSSSTAASCRRIPTRRGLAIRPAAGKATRSSSRPSATTIARCSTDKGTSTLNRCG